MQEDDPDMIVERRKRFGLTTWSDIQSLISIGVMLVAGLVWVLSISAKQTALQERVNSIDEQLKGGLLPVVVVRLTALEHQLTELQVQLKSMARDNH